MYPGGGELVATDEPTVVSEPFLDAIVVEDSQSDGGFPNPPCTDESDWGEIFCEVDDLFDQIVAPETGPRQWRGKFSRRDAMQSKTANSMEFEIANLFWI